jgi:hypothetical protein
MDAITQAKHDIMILRLRLGLLERRLLRILAAKNILHKQPKGGRRKRNVR